MLEVVRTAPEEFGVVCKAAIVATVGALRNERNIIACAEKGS